MHTILTPFKTLDYDFNYSIYAFKEHNYYYCKIGIDLNLVIQAHFSHQLTSYSVCFKSSAVVFLAYKGSLQLDAVFDHF